MIRRSARAVLTFAVRRGRPSGTPWGEALLAEFDETQTRWEAVRWAVSGLPVALRREHSRRELMIRRLVVALVAGVLVLPLVQAFVLGLLFIPSDSNGPTLRIGDRVAVDRVAFHLTGVHYGDLVEFTLRRDDGGADKMLKRIVGLPGDVIECAGGRVIRNGQPVEENYLATGMATDCTPVSVPSDMLYVLGDARDISVDSRKFGFVAQSAIDGRVVARFWPLDRLGSLS